MTSTATEPGTKSSSHKAKPDYTTSELYDSPEDLARWPLLAPLLRTWQTEVWEKDHSEFRGCWHYDQEAIRLQSRHKWAVYAAAVAGSAAIIFAILQLGMEHRICGIWLADLFRSVVNAIVGTTSGSEAMQERVTYALMGFEVVCLILVIVCVGFGLLNSLDHRWRELRFKAEQYRMLKFRFLHDAARWLDTKEEERGLHLFTHLVQIHSANREIIREWIHWKRELLPLLESPATKPEEPLAQEIVGYFRERRLEPQRKYFEKRGHALHGIEKLVRWVGPGLFFASILLSLAHAALEVGPRIGKALGIYQASAETVNKETTSSDEVKVGHQQESFSRIAMIAFLFALLAAIFPVIAAGVRTVRGAFEFGRNSLRFESMAHNLEHILGELKKTHTPEAMLTILRRGEYAMENEHRAWMRLMMEAEWFG
ncbi:MAG: hypothetical protein K8R36_20325 [Planctomycetales bacterium]|nr:hypothetical protein [Planctomycetales bacterium]